MPDATAQRETLNSLKSIERPYALAIALNELIEPVEVLHNAIAHTQRDTTEALKVYVELVKTTLKYLNKLHEIDTTELKWKASIANINGAIVIGDMIEASWLEVAYKNALIAYMRAVKSIETQEWKPLAAFTDTKRIDVELLKEANRMSLKERHERETAKPTNDKEPPVELLANASKQIATIINYMWNQNTARKSALMNAVWPDGEPEHNTYRQAIKRLRNHLEACNRLDITFSEKDEMVTLERP